MNHTHQSQNCRCESLVYAEKENLTPMGRMHLALGELQWPEARLERAWMPVRLASPVVVNQHPWCL